MANGWGFGSKTPVSNTYQSPNRRLSQLLLQGQRGQPRQQRRGKTGQIADFLQSGLGAYLMTKDMGQQQAAQEAFIKGASGEGGMTGATAALQGLSGNPYAQNRLQNLLMQDVARGQKETQRLKELESAKGLYKFQQQEKVFPPKIPVPGRDVPFGPGVQEQKLAAQRAGKTTWGPMPGVSGMLVSSAGQVQAVPQTPQQAAQTKIETEAAQAQAEAQREFPQTKAKAQEAMANIEALMGHPGLKGMIGAPDTVSGLFYKATGTPLAGTKEADFNARLSQIGGQQFLQAFESLKGGGAISEVEGKKATVALSRLTETGQSEDSYRQAGAELIAILKSGLARSGVAAGQALTGQPTMGQPLKPEVLAMLPPGRGGQAPMGQPVMGPSMQDIRSGESSFPLESSATGYQPSTPMVTDSAQYRNMLSGFNAPPANGALASMQGQQLPPVDQVSGAALPQPPQGVQPPLDGVVQITTETEYNALPPGTAYSVAGARPKRKQ